MEAQTKNCQNCHNDFTIEPEDFAFYKKIKVPPPTFCSQCRLQRRLVFYNLFALYKRKCDLCGIEKISIYAPNAPYTVYCPQCWWSDKWDPFVYGREYDFSRPFFEQFDELLHDAPLLGLSLDLTVATTSPYCNHAGNLKDCYLVFNGSYNENAMYSFDVDKCTDILDCALILESNLCYDSMHSYKNSRCAGLRSQVTNSIACAFLKDSFNCNHCFASANLRNKNYYIFNQPYTKEKYAEEIKKWDLGSYRSYQEVKKLAEEHWKKFPPKPVFEENTVNCTGSHVFQSKNCKECFEVSFAEDCKYIFSTSHGFPVKDCYDVSFWGENLSSSYETCVVGGDSSSMRFCDESGINTIDVEYCKLATGGSHQFGSVSAKKGKHIIFNKRYGEEEYHTLRAKIIEHMNSMPYVDTRGREYRYGEFFPVALSPFAYNETIAPSFFPLQKDESEKAGLRWKEEDKGQKHTVTIDARDLPDHIKDASDSIMREIIGCTECGKGFKMIPAELKFLRERNFPLPRKCPFCRIQNKFDQWVKNLRLIPRVCDKCGKEFKTKYTEEEAPIILCKQCYQQEVV